MRFPQTFGRTTYFVANRSSVDLIVEVTTATEMRKRIHVPSRSTAFLDTDAIFGVNPSPSDTFQGLVVRSNSGRVEDPVVVWQPSHEQWLGGRTDQAEHGHSEYTLVVTDRDLGLRAG